VGGKGTLFYNVAAGPLPAGAKPALKMGINNWSLMETHALEPSQELKEVENSCWWSVDLELHQVKLSNPF